MTHVQFNTRPGKALENLFDEVLNGNWGREFTAFPPVNIYELADGFNIELNVPGRNKEDFKVNIEKGLLTISYDKQEENKLADHKVIRREFNFKNFSRSFSLNEKVDADNILAKYENGLLKFWLPKKEEPKKEVKQIAIQ